MCFISFLDLIYYLIFLQNFKFYLSFFSLISLIIVSLYEIFFFMNMS
jgi:hypothetical protein